MNMGICCGNLKKKINMINIIRCYYLNNTNCIYIHKHKFRLVFKNYIKNYFNKFRSYNNISNNINRIGIYKAYFKIQSYTYCKYIYKLYKKHNIHCINKDLNIIIHNLFKNQLKIIDKIGIYYFNLILHKYYYNKKYRIIHNSSPYNLSFLYNMQDPDIELSLVHLNKLIRYIKYWNTPKGYEDFTTLILKKRKHL